VSKRTAKAGTVDVETVGRLFRNVTTALDRAADLLELESDRAGGRAASAIVEGILDALDAASKSLPDGVLPEISVEPCPPSESDAAELIQKIAEESATSCYLDKGATLLWLSLSLSHRTQPTAVQAAEGRP
jgi:hypothetical protein